MRLTQKVGDWAGRVKRDAVTLWFASRHPRTPWLPKALCLVVVAYALSPIDLIPDFVPILGYVDDVMLLPALIWLAVRLLPGAVLEESRAKANSWLATRGSKPRSYAGAAAIVALWLGLTAATGYWLLRR